MLTPELSILELILPKGVLEWFDIVSGFRDDETVRIVLEEKNNPPIDENSKNIEVISKGFKDITITDFPLRGRRTFIVFRRRRWQIKGENKYLKRDIQLIFPGTQLAAEFADFLKDEC